MSDDNRATQAEQLIARMQAARTRTSWARERHRRRRLRLRDLRWRAYRAADHCLGEARCLRGGRPHHQPEAVGTPHMQGKR